jgi:hypothetical protein
LIAEVGTAYGSGPRGLYCYDFETNGLLWRFEMAMPSRKASLVDIDHDGRLAVLFGSYSLANHRALADGTDDAHSYLYAVSREGQLLWRRETNGVHSACEPLLADLDGDGRKAIVVLASCSYGMQKYICQTNRYDPGRFDPYEPRGELISAPEFGRIVKYDLRGNRVAGPYDGGAALRSLAAVDCNGDHKLKIIAADRFGFLHILDSNLNLIDKVEVVHLRPDCAWINLQLQEVTDLDGDGRPELVFCASQIQPSGEGPGSPSDPPLRPTHFDNRVVVLSSEFKRLAEYVVDSEWESDPGFRVLAGPRSNTHSRQLLVLAPRPVILEWSKGAQAPASLVTPQRQENR